MHKVEDLKIWSKTMELAKLTYQVLVELPETEKYGLSSQIKRSVISIPSNIAEGAGRNSNKEFKYYLNVANGSTCELETQLRLVVALNLIEKETIEPLLDICVELQK